MLDTRRIRSAFERAAPGFDDADFINCDIRDRLLSRLEVVGLDPQQALDLGAGTGAAASSLKARFPGCGIFAVDFSINMLKAGARNEKDFVPVCADATRLPFATESVDLVFSNLLLQLCPEAGAVLVEARRVLRFPGLLAFSTLGPDSLIELRKAWASADGYSHVAEFPDMHIIGDALLRAGFAEPVLDVEKVTVTYEDLSRLMSDLRNIGSTNATPHRNPGLTGRRSWERLVAAYEAFRNEEGRLPVTLELVFGLAWCGQPAKGVSPRNGTVEIPVDRLARRNGKFSGSAIGELPH